MARKKVGRKKEPTPKRGIAWPRWTGFRGMTVRDWLPIVGALLIPVVIAAGTWGITWQQGKIEDQRAQAEQTLGEQRAQDDALQAYLDEMGNLMLNHDLQGQPSDPVINLARARTTTVLGRLDAEGNRAVTLFLNESKLAGGDLLSNTDLSEAKLRDAVLPGANLNAADLQRADLSDANLYNADLFHANLSCNDGVLTASTDGLAPEHLGTPRRCPPRSGADLSDANLHSADLELADLRGADLSGAFLFHADLQTVDLRRAELRKAELYGAHLTGDLRRADLSGATGITNKELEQQASLEGATMPNGQKYEDWIKSYRPRGGWGEQRPFVTDCNQGSGRLHGPGPVPHSPGPTTTV